MDSTTDAMSPFRARRASSAKSEGRLTRAPFAARSLRVAATPRVMAEVTPEPPGAAIERLLSLDPVPIVELASVSSRSGLGSSETRARAWPRLLALDPTRPDADGRVFEERAAALGARERNQIDLDVNRSHWIPASAGADARAKLSRVIQGVLASHTFECRYYQGLHDVAAILILVCGDAAPAVLDRLVLGHLRDNVRGGGLDAVLDTLRLLPHLVAVADPELHAAIFPSSARSAFAQSRRPGPSTRRKHTHTDSDSDEIRTDHPRDGDEPSSPSSSSLLGDDDAFEFLGVADFSDMEHVRGCHFAVSWVLTWFAHGLDDVDDAARLFDVLLGSDPLMPLYVGAAAIVADRDALLALARGLPLPGEPTPESTESNPSPRDDWPVVEGMLHTRLAELPALVGREPEPRGTTRKDARARDAPVRLRLDFEDDRARVTVLVADDGDRTPEGWGVDAVVVAALDLHQRIPPRSLFSVLGIEPDPFSAFAAYPYPWLRTNRRGFGEGPRREGEENDARASGGEDDDGNDDGDDVGVASSSPGIARKVGAGAGPSRLDDDEGFHFRGLGNGKTATALFAQRLGANIRRGVSRGVSELRKVETSEPMQGLRDFFGRLGGASGGSSGARVPRLDD